MSHIIISSSGRSLTNILRYGVDWHKYKQLVRYRIFPYIY